MKSRRNPDSPLARKEAALKEYRSARRAAARSERISGRSISGTEKRAANPLLSSPEELRAEAEALLKERHKVVSDEMRKIKATSGADAHRKASMLFDLAGNKEERRKLRKQLEGKESGTASTAAADAMAVSRELLEMWMSEGNTVTLANDGKIQF